MFLRNLLARYRTNESGQVAVITAVVAVPLMLGVSLAVDSHRMGLEQTRLQSALDSAALAAVADQTLTVDERSQTAEARFRANMSDDENVKFRVVSSDNQKVELEAQMRIPTLFAGIVGRESLTFEGTSAAEVTKGRTVCMMALDPDSPKSFDMDFGGHLTANCSIQVNSVDDAAAFVQGGSTATAESFCVAGGASGDFKPFVNTECAQLADPYADLVIPATTEPCIDEDEFTALKRDWRSSRDAVETHNAITKTRAEQAADEGRPYNARYYEKLHLKPGNYCRGIPLTAKEFILDPGEYHITGGNINLRAGTQLTGEGVTFIMYDDAIVDVRNGSELHIKAPTSGPLDGLLFAQVLNNNSPSNPSFPNAISKISSGSSLDFLGTVYLPSHRIEFVQGSGSETYAPATSFIAHQIKITDDANIVVSADHEAAGISPIQPRSDDGARLVR